MHKFSDNEERIKESLKHMPEIKDDLDKSQLYQRISSEIKQPETSHTKKRFAFVPVFAAIIAAGVLLLLAPLVIDETMVQDQSEHTADQALDKNTSDKGTEVREESKSAAESETDPETFAKFQNASDSHVIQDMKNHETIVYGAVTDLQGQYIIPLSLIVPESADKNQYYSALGHYLNEEAWGIRNYMFSEADFQMDQANHQVQIDFPEGFSPAGQEGAIAAGLFEDLLATMFLPVQINQAVFKEPLNMKQIGTVKEIPLHPQKTIYKRYQATGVDRGFLVQVPIDGQSDFKTALAEMKQDEETYHVTGTVPDAADFSVKENGSQLQLRFIDYATIPKGQTMITMIDAILMTANSFGYEEVMFSNTSAEKIGSYDLTAPVKVPKGANPIHVP
ncbi:hypothetical protein [Lentibacillus salicampi]|uniref:Negative regulator of sigma-X activity n=1 Tax=Lentibacillus salicampi TaxID=175306 RepID=A0A4Y9AED8_9BACI|nr:hypothetical protein [Lentibacillus salicampi]TFJ93785.1 hypothetical protein E4U82_05340 [Lentibacillus salicampi]